MRFIENLRDAEKKGSETIRRGVERVREEWADVERRIRQRMRIYPQKQKAAAASAQPGQTPEQEASDTPREPGEPRTPIVSIRGKDLNQS